MAQWHNGQSKPAEMLAEVNVV